jgi:hypothetical protein
MNRYLLIMMLLFAGASHGGRWKQVTLTYPVSLRTMDASRNALIPLDELKRLPRGTVLRYDYTKVRERLVYENKRGELVRSKGKWITTIVIKSVPGNRVSSSKLRRINRKKLFISAVNFPEISQAPQVDTKEFTGDYWTCFDQLANTGISSAGLQNLLTYLTDNRSNFKTTRYALMSDYSLKTTEDRLYVIDFKNCTSENFLVAHARFSDGVVKKNYARSEKYRDGNRHIAKRCVHPDRAGKVRGSTRNSFSNPYHNRYGMIRPGFFKINGYHHTQKNWPKINSSGMKALALYGLEDQNRKAREHGVVIHESFYFKGAGDSSYRSLGCPAMNPKKLKSVYRKIKDSTVYYSYVPDCE